MNSISGTRMLLDAEKEIDPIRLSVLWSRLVAIVDEGASGLVRSCYSQVVRDFHDYCTGIFDHRGQLLAHSTRTTCGFIGVIAEVMRHFIEIWGDDIAEGDVFITNDPWLASGHLVDITVAKPVFHQGDLVGFALCIVHHSDIGGRMADINSRDIYEEGIQIPPLKLFRRGVEDATIMKFIRQNVRTADKVEGDLRAQLASLHICDIGMCKLLDDYPDVRMKELADSITRRSEENMRAAIRRLPHGSYTSSITLPPQGAHKTPIPIVMRLEISDGSIVLDFTGTSGEVEAAINSPLYYAKGYAFYALKLLLDPETPNNEGCVRPLHFEAPLGCILNCERPAPTWGRAAISHSLPELVFGALKDVMPDRVIADSGSTPINTMYTRGLKSDGTRFLALQSDRGGAGATGRGDGKSCVSFPYNTANIPIEVTEADTALVYLRKELAIDSGGAGRWRGGLGQVVEFEIAGPPIAPVGKVTVIARGSMRSDDSIYPVNGLAGGGKGKGANILLNGGVYPHGGTTSLASGERMFLTLPGGGGVGDPFEREVERVLDDVREGLVSVEAARADYGVVINPETMVADEMATRTLRRRKPAA